MKLDKILILDESPNKKGQLFARLMSDLFHVLRYNEPRLNIHKSGREIDLEAKHRTEKKVAIAEFKAHDGRIGGDEINKFVGALSAEKVKISNILKFKGKNEIVGYFISLSGFTETAIEQELDLNEDRVILVSPDKIVDELIKGKIVVPIETALTSLPNTENLELVPKVNLIGTNRGWLWAFYFSDNNLQSTTHYTLLHAEGKPLIVDLVSEILDIDKKTKNYFKDLKYHFTNTSKAEELKFSKSTEKYFNYIKNECGEILFDGLPTDKETGSIKVKLEDIFVPLQFTNINDKKNKRENIGSILAKHSKIAILGKPGSGKSTLIKRIATAYAFPERKDEINDHLPKKALFPIFIRCRELGSNVDLSITEIIQNIPNRAEISSCSFEFFQIISDKLQKGEALLLIDGLDEISNDRQRIAFVYQLRTFLATYPTIHIILTSREAGFRIVGGSLSNYCEHFKVADMSDRDISSLTLKWHKAIIDNTKKTLKEANALISIILKDYKIRVLAQNPLLLTTLLFVKRGAGYLPAKKSVLYQEMIKLLLVTWNVQGHDQLEIEETEPQLSYVAFWMTQNGTLNITEPDLKSCLISIRNQLPEILGYTKTSVSTFIKQVEFRSSLLIMTGHKELEDGSIIPIYEFLHFSIQEYLTAKAIVEKYLLNPLAKKNSLEIIKPYIKNESWKEIIPFVAVLSKRESKSLIEYIVNLTKKEYESSANNRISEYNTYNLLGNCIANEIQISKRFINRINKVVC